MWVLEKYDSSSNSYQFCEVFSSWNSAIDYVKENDPNTVIEYPKHETWKDVFTEGEPFLPKTYELHFQASAERMARILRYLSRRKVNNRFSDLAKV